MAAITIEKLKKELNDQFDAVYLSGRKLIISKKKKRVVMLGMKEYNSLKETAYLLSTENNRKHLDKSLLQAKKKQVVKVDLCDL